MGAGHRAAWPSERPLYFVCVRASRHPQAAAADPPETYRRIVEGTRDGIWLLDADGRTTFVNAQMAAMLGQTVEGMLGRSPRSSWTRRCGPRPTA